MTIAHRKILLRYLRALLWNFPFREVPVRMATLLQEPVPPPYPDFAEPLHLRRKESVIRQHNLFRLLMLIPAIVVTIGLYNAYEYTISLGTLYWDYLLFSLFCSVAVIIYPLTLWFYFDRDLLALLPQEKKPFIPQAFLQAALLLFAIFHQVVFLIYNNIIVGSLKEDGMFLVYIMDGMQLCAILIALYSLYRYIFSGSRFMLTLFPQCLALFLSYYLFFYHVTLFAPVDGSRPHTFVMYPFYVAFFASLLYDWRCRKITKTNKIAGPAPYIASLLALCTLVVGLINGWPFECSPN